MMVMSGRQLNDAEYNEAKHNLNRYVDQPWKFSFRYNNAYSALAWGCRTSRRKCTF